VVQVILLLRSDGAGENPSLVGTVSMAHTCVMCFLEGDSRASLLRTLTLLGGMVRLLQHGAYCFGNGCFCEDVSSLFFFVFLFLLLKI
jgi:hypothetical protein